MGNIILIGMPGSGKSTIGVVLAKVLGYNFLDSDIVIQEKYKMKLSEIIEEKGDSGFIQAEDEINREISVVDTVIATGGSAVYGRSAMKHFMEIGTVIYLKVPFLEIEKRVGSLFKRGVVSNGKATIEEIFRDRAELYEKYADITVHGEDQNIRGIVEEIQRILTE